MSAVPTVIKTLKKPWKVGGKEATEIELRAPLVADMLAAEEEANPAIQPTKYQVALAAQTMVRAGEFTGPFTVGQFAKMDPANFAVVRAGMSEATQLGED